MLKENKHYYYYYYYQTAFMNNNFVIYIMPKYVGWPILELAQKKAIIHCS